MAKRTASSDLNHENWDREEDREEAGSFMKAADDVIKKRVIKVAKRRNPISSVHSNDESKPNVFGGFTAFAKTPLSDNTSSAATTAAPFGFLVNIAEKPEESKTNGNKDEKSDEYYAKLKGLNESVTEWIKSHVSENPFVNLQPVFKDYEKHFSELEKAQDNNKPQYSFGPPSPSKSTKSSSMSDAPGAKPIFSFGSATSSSSKFSFGAVTTSQATTTTTSAKFSFENNSAPTATSQSPAAMGFCNTSNMINTSGGGAPFLSFGDKSNNTTLFNSTHTPKFSFGSDVTVMKPSQTEETKSTTQEEDEDAPPKVDFTPVVEEGHVYTIRCKVYVKKDGAFGDRGVGNLYLKPIPDSEKYQLIVRADTNLGNLLCNFILSDGIPMQRMGKKDVMLVCLPTPETKPPPVPILLRVKATEDADKLLETLNKYKK